MPAALGRRGPAGACSLALRARGPPGVGRKGAGTPRGFVAGEIGGQQVCGEAPGGGMEAGCSAGPRGPGGQWWAVLPSLAPGSIPATSAP